MKAQAASLPAPTAEPSIEIVPASGSRSPQISSSMVDLPHPEGPTRPRTPCAPASRSMPAIVSSSP